MVNQLGGPEIDKCFLTPEMLSPVLAIEAGYSMYLADAAEPESVIARSAKLAVKQFESLVDTFTKDPQGGLYCLQLRYAANSLARGIARCKANLDLQEKAADKELQQMIVDTADGEKILLRIKAIWNALLIGGVVYFFAQILFGVSSLSDGSVNSTRQNVTLALAIAFTLISSEIRGWTSRRTKRRLFARYKTAVDDAEAEYKRTAREEYQFSARLAECAWKQMTDIPPPITDGFGMLLQGAITNWSPGDDKASSEG